MRVCLEGSVKGWNCRGRPRAAFIGQLVEELGYQSYVELKRLTSDWDTNLLVNNRRRIEMLLTAF